MLMHPAAMGIRTARGAALFIMRARATLAADANEDGHGKLRDAENVMLFRDNLIDRWGEPGRTDALEAIAWLGTDWATLYGIAMRDNNRDDFDGESSAEIEVRHGHYTRRVLACRALWQGMKPTPEERAAVKAALVRMQGGWR